MAIQAIDAMLYSAQLNPGELCKVMQGMSDGEKSRFLWSFTSWPKPTIGRNGFIVVPDPSGETHYVEHGIVDGADVFTCHHDGYCFATHSAARAYRINTGIEYEDNTGAPIRTLRTTEEPR